MPIEHPFDRLRLRRSWPGVAAIVLIACHFALIWHGRTRQWITYDEHAHLPAGLSYIQKRTFFVYHHNPPLIRLLSALPVALAGPVVDYGRSFRYVPGARPEWELGDRFLRANGPKTFEYYKMARAVIAILSVAGALVVFAWSRALFGNLGGLISLALWCLSPDILAHGQLATTDVGATFFGLSSAYVFWRFLRRPTLGWCVLAGVSLGCAVASKFTMLALYPAYAAVGIVNSVTSELRRRRGFGPDMVPSGRTADLQDFLIILLTSLFIVNSVYLFEGSFQPLGSFEFQSRLLTAPDPSSNDSGRSNRFSGTWLSAIPMPLPYHFITGLDAQKFDSDLGFLNYFSGTFRQGGWGTYYLVAILIRQPLGTLALAVAAMLIALLKPCCRRDGTTELLLFLPGAAFFALVAFQLGVQYSRYLIPMLPFVYIWMGRLGPWLMASPRLSKTLPVLIAGSWSALSGVAVHPHELSYFNELVGGAVSGHEYLLESSDWGQDALALKEWMDDHPRTSPLHLAYFGTADPLYLGLSYTPAPFWEPSGNLQDSRESAGERHDEELHYYAVSVQLLHGLSWAIGDGRGHRLDVPWDGFAYFSTLRPIARAGYSILIYQASPSLLDSVRRSWKPSAPPR